MLTVTRKMAKLLTVSRKSHHPVETLLLLQWAIILKCDLFGFGRVALENEISTNFQKSGKVDINTKLNGMQACQLFVIFQRQGRT